MKKQSEFEMKMEYFKCISKINNIGRQKHKKAYRAKNEKKRGKFESERLALNHLKVLN